MATAVVESGHITPPPLPLSSQISRPGPSSHKLEGYEFYRTVLGSPKYVVAPMVDQSELVRRVSCDVATFFGLTAIGSTRVFCAVIVVDGKVAMEDLGTAVWCTGELTFASYIVSMYRPPLQLVYTPMINAKVKSVSFQSDVIH